MGKRADVVIISEGHVFVIEYKVGADNFQKSAVDQVMDYALDLKNFHEGSHHRIDEAKRRNRKSICFVTGVPGSGKTLAGLNIAAEQKHASEEEHAIFLSGNGPLVDVLREALAMDEVERTKTISKKDAYRHASAFIQNIHHFRDEYVSSPNAPVEHVVVFDEAQRAWNKDQASRFMREKRGHADFNMSEPEFLLSVMNRHSNWCVVICLIGGGQEINTGEAGLQEWLSAIMREYGHWHILADASRPDAPFSYQILSHCQRFVVRNNVQQLRSFSLQMPENIPQHSDHPTHPNVTPTSFPTRE